MTTNNTPTSVTMADAFHAWGFRDDDLVHTAIKKLVRRDNEETEEFRRYPRRLNDFLAQEFDGKVNHFIGICTHDGSQSFAATSMCDVVELAIDVDYGKDGHKHAPHASREEALQAIKQNLLPATCIVHTGGGFQVHYRLTERIPVKTSLARFQRISKTLAGLVKGDDCHDVPHVFRLPHTNNIKPGAPVRQATIEEFNPNIQYSLDELESYAESKSEKTPSAKTLTPPSKKKKRKKKKRSGRSDRSANCFKFIERNLEVGKSERQILAAIKKKDYYSHYSEKAASEKECVKDIRRIRKKLKAERFPKPRNKVKRICVDDWTLKPEVKDTETRFAENHYTVSPKVTTTLKILDKLVSEKQQAILSLPCASGKTTAAIILAAAHASSDHRFWIVVEKIQDVKRIAETLKGLGADAREWHGYSESVCHMKWHEFQRSKASDNCKICINLDCTARHRNLAPNRWDDANSDIIVTTHSHWRAALESDELTGSIGTVIIDEAPTTMEHLSISPRDVQTFYDALANHPDLSKKLQTDLDFIYERLIDGACRTVPIPNLIRRNAKELRKILFKLRDRELIHIETFEKMIAFTNFFDNDEHNIFGMLHPEMVLSTEEDDGFGQQHPVMPKELTMHFIRGTVNIQTDIQHIILDGSAKLSDVYWSGFHIYECTALKQCYPNTQIHVIHGNPTKTALRKRKKFGQILECLDQVIENDDRVLVLTNKAGAIPDEELTGNIECLTGLLAGKGVDTVSLHRGAHIGSNEGRECTVTAVCMSLFSTLPHYVLRTALVTEQDIDAERIWQKGHVFKVACMRNVGGFADSKIQQSYCRELSHNLYQTIMRGVIRSDSDAEYRAVCLATGLDIISVLEAYLPGAKLVHESAEIVKMLEEGERVSAITEAVKGERTFPSAYRQVQRAANEFLGVLLPC